MRNSIFTLVPSARSAEERAPGLAYPEIVRESVQVFECTWDDSYPTDCNEETEEIHFVLLIDKIIMKKRWWDCLLKGKGFPKLPVGFGFRNNSKFWFSSHSRPYAVTVPQSKGVNIDSVKFATSRIDPDLPWQDEAYAKLQRVPRVFLNRVVTQIIQKAQEDGIEEITPEYLDHMRDKRDQEKSP
jgi:hypothetical protein